MCVTDVRARSQATGSGKPELHDSPPRGLGLRPSDHACTRRRDQATAGLSATPHAHRSGIKTSFGKTLHKFQAPPPAASLISREPRRAAAAVPSADASDVLAVLALSRWRAACLLAKSGRLPPKAWCPCPNSDAGSSIRDRINQHSVGRSAFLLGATPHHVDAPSPPEAAHSTSLAARDPHVWQWSRRWEQSLRGWSRATRSRPMACRRTPRLTEMPRCSRAG